MVIYQDTKIELLQHAGLLTWQAYNALYKIGIRTIGEITEWKKKRFLNQIHFSQGELKDINSLLKSIKSGYIYIAQRYQSPNYLSANIPPSITSSLKYPNEVNSLNVDYNTFTRAYVFKAYNNISQLRGDAIDLVRELFPNAQSMGDAILNESYDVLTVHRDLGMTGNVELRELIQHYLKVMRKYILQAKYYEQRILDTVENLINILEKSINTFDFDVLVNDFISARQRIDLFNYFDTLTSSLSVEARAIQLMYMPNLSDAFKLFGIPEFLIAEKCSLSLDHPALHEVWNMIQNIEDALGEEIYSGADVKLQAFIFINFSWLSAAGRRFVFRFHYDYNTFPLFYIIWQMILRSSERELDIYALANGIRDGQRHKLEDIAVQKMLTRERARQLLEKGKREASEKVKRLFNWSDYKSLLDSNLITALSPKYRMIQEDEKLPQDFGVFCSLLTIVGDFEVISIGEKLVAVNKRLRPYVYVKHIKNQLIKLSQKRHCEDSVFALQSMVADVPEELRDDAFKIICQVAQVYSDIPFDENWKVAFKQNYIDIPQEIFKILEAYGKPMSLEAIFEQFKRKYPDHKYSEPEQLRMTISKHGHIKSIGMTSTYGLDTWKHVFYGNIRDLLRQTLKASSYPIHIDKLTAIVKKYFPTTNAKSISSSMTQETAKELVAFKGGFFGLSSKKYSSKYRPAEPERRYTFNERLKMLTEFIATYHRFPYTSGGNLEQSLQRWLYNVENNQLEFTKSQKNKLETALQPFRDSHFPENETEERFLENCEQYKDHIEKEYELPTRSTNIELYDWMKRAKESYNSYIDNRRYYLTQLFNYIQSLGFDLQ